MYVKKLLINGVEHTQPILERSVLIGDETKGGLVLLEFFMTSIPKSGLCGNY